MNVESITRWLEAIGVPHEVISIGSEADNAWCVLRTEQAIESPNDKDTDKSEGVLVAWEVFWREQGNRYDWARFSNEQVACHYLFGRLAWSQVVRGAVGMVPEKQPAMPPPA
ncbi:MAG: hypothetical protein ACRDQW_08835 [Haloechinothrix sp.]